MSLNDGDPENDPKRSGVAVVGRIEAKLIENLQKHLESKFHIRVISRQTHLQWNSDCDAIVTYFETVSYEGY